MKNEVMLLGTKCKLGFGYYPNNTIGITAYRISDGESCCRLTINYESLFQGSNYRKQFCFPLVVVKNVDENEGVYQQLIKAGVVTNGPYLSGTGGTIQVGVLSKEWQVLAKKQLEKIKKHREKPSK